MTVLVEVAGLEPTVSSTRNWRDTNFATPRNNLLISAHLEILVHQKLALIPVHPHRQLWIFFVHPFFVPKYYIIFMGKSQCFFQVF